MSDFLSNLIERSFTDAPVIRPRVPSLFEPRSVEIFDEQQSSTSAPVSELSMQETGTAQFSTSVPDQMEEHLPKSAASKRKGAPAEAAPKTTHLVVPLASSRGEEGRSTSTGKVFENLPKTPASQLLRRRDFPRVDQGSSKSPPIIRVTIGRVEVRAVQSPAPAPKQAKSRTPKLSLEDYLRKRTRGSR